MSTEKENGSPEVLFDLGTNTSPGAKSWAVDDSDPEVAVRVREFGDAIPADKRREYDARSFRANPRYVDSQAATEVHGRQFATALYRKDVLPEKFTGRTPWADYRRHFEVCKRLNAWDDVEAGQYLATRLQGPALRVLNNLSADGPILYSELVTQLEKRFGPGEQAENFLLELRMRRRGRDESVQELGQAIRDLSSLAYPEMGTVARERLAKVHFMEAINEPEIRASIFRSNPVTLDDAIQAALATESFMKSEKARDRHRQSRPIRTVDAKTESAPMDDRTKKEIGELKASVKQLSDMIQKLIAPPTSRSDPVCYNCGNPGHFSRACPAKDRRQGNDMRSSRWATARPPNQPGPKA
ncbi:uncharacterized protein [Diadema setosum]|uniref:uncharacterized protein n=1 Tax=Diadema setosum TaxID=31175 RepID=UPI003B3A7EBB